MISCIENSPIPRYAPFRCERKPRAAFRRATPAATWDDTRNPEAPSSDRTVQCTRTIEMIPEIDDLGDYLGEFR